MGINFADVTTGTGGDFTPVDLGRYNVIIEEAKTGVSKNNNEKIMLTMKILEGDFKNRKLWADMAVTNKTFGFVKQLLVAAGSSLANSTNAELRDIVIDLQNKKMSVYTEPEFREGSKPRNKVSGYQPFGEDSEGPVEATPKNPLFK